MKKRFGKDTIKSKYSKYSPLEKLNLIKDRLNEYKDLTYPEFKVIFTQDELFKELKLDLLYVNDLFYEISKNKKGENNSRSKYIEQRDLMIWLFKNYTGLTYEQIEKIIIEYDFNMSFQQISKICNKFGFIPPEDINK